MLREIFSGVRIIRVIDTRKQIKKKIIISLIK